MIQSNANRLPGVGTEYAAEFRGIMASGAPAYLPGGVVVDGDLARDPLNTAYVDTLRAGNLMGIVTASGLWAPSVIGVTGEALDATETECTCAAAVVTELVRRVGASGTFTLVGPPTASGTVRSATVTYSAATGTAITYTALGTSAVWAATATAGTVVFEVEADSGSQTAGTAFTTPVAWNASASTVDTALEALSTVGTGKVAATTTGTAGEFILTFSPDLGNPKVRVYGNAVTLSRTTAGVDGRFVTGSLIMPTDGSQTPVGILAIASGLKVTDEQSANIDVACNKLAIGSGDGVVDASQIVNYPADASLKTWVKDQLKAKGQWAFDDDFGL